MPAPHLRAADSDRAAMATVLGEHMAAGRLTVAEYEERLAAAYAARTYGELDDLVADLPAPRATGVAAPEPRTEPAQGACQPWGAWGMGMHAWGWGGWAGGSSLRAAWASWLTTSLIVVTIWLATSIGSGDLLYPWPVWVVGPWGAVLLAQTLTADRRDGRRELGSGTGG
ncbi:DUF1707 SHOCT-like domain-containing protein [Blastococcus sp. SYSU D00820]